MQYLAIKLIELYQRVFSFDTGVLAFFAPNGACRHRFYGEPSCSEYTKIKISETGLVRGIGLGIKRILSCR